MRARPTSSATATLPVRGLELVDPEPGVSVGAAVADLERMDGVVYAEPDHVVRQTASPTTRCSATSGAWRDPRARGLGRHDRLAAGDRRRGRHRDRRRPSGPRPEPVDEPRRVGRRARDQRHRRRRQRLRRRRARLGLRRQRRPAPGRQRPRHARGGHDRRARQRRQRRGRRELVARHHGAALARRDGSGYVSDAVTASLTPRATARGSSTPRSAAPGFSRAGATRIAAAPSTLFVVAAGNDGADNDAARYPCNYDLANVVCVAANDQDGALAVVLQLRRRHVDLAAPGVDSSAPGRGGYAVPTAPRWRRRTSPARPHCCRRTTASDGRRPRRRCLASRTRRRARRPGGQRRASRRGRGACPTHPAPPEPPVRPAARGRRRGADDRLRRPSIAPRPGVSLRIDPGRLRGVRTRGLRLEFGAVGGVPRRHRRPHRRAQRSPPAPGLAHDRPSEREPREGRQQDGHGPRLSARAARALRPGLAPARRRPRRRGRRPRATAAPPSGARR